MTDIRPCKTLEECSNRPILSIQECLDVIANMELIHWSESGFQYVVDGKSHAVPEPLGQILMSVVKSVQYHKPSSVIARIAKSVLNIDTLTVRNSDSADFHDLHVRSVQQALTEAYAAGQQQKKST